MWRGIVVGLLASSGLWAGFDQEFTEAAQFYAQRPNLEAVQRAQQIYESIALRAEQAQEASSVERALVGSSKLCIYIGEHLTVKQQKLTWFDKGRACAEKIRTLFPDNAAGYYYTGISLARRGQESPGDFFRNKDRILQEINTALLKDATFDGYGSDRFLGRFYHQFPFGRDLNRAAQHLSRAFNEARSHSTNAIFYADLLVALNRANEAREILRWLIALIPEELDPERIPETIEDQEDARRILERIGTR